MTTILIILAVAIVAVLAAIAVYLNIKLHQRNKRIAEAQREQAANTAKKVQQIQQDIRFLARAYIDDQVELNEVSLRIHNLVNYLGLDPQQRKVYDVFDTIAADIKHIPTHNSWKSLDKITRRKYEKEFDNIESKYEDQARITARKISEVSQDSFIQ